MCTVISNHCSKKSRVGKSIPRLLSPIFFLWKKRPKDRRTILKVEMALSDLIEESEHTGSLFAAEERSKSLYSTVDKLNARFGKQAVYFASGHAARDRGGLHIAFNHIPDPETDK